MMQKQKKPATPARNDRPNKQRNRKMVIANNSDPVKKNASRRVTISLPPADALTLLQNIASRAGWLRNRREPDPMIRATCHFHAEKCEAIAAKIANAIGGAE